MKIYFALIVVTLSLSAFGQKTEEYQTNNYESFELAPQLIRPQGTVKNKTEVQEFLTTYYATPANTLFKTISVKQSKQQLHYTVQQIYQNKEVYLAVIKVNTALNGNITSILSSYAHINENPHEDWPNINLSRSNSNVKQNIEDKLVWYKTKTGYSKGLLCRFLDHQNLLQHSIVNNEGVETYNYEVSSHFSDGDTIGHGFVFGPDPITSANKSYGGSYIDNQDNTNPQLDNERLDVELNIQYDSSINQFILENQYVKLVDVSLPTIPPVTSSDPDFYYDRSQSGFENVNVVYHITEQQNYIQSLGYMKLMNLQVEADCHAFGGADNSSFTPTNPPLLQFGTGGVDDAEDVDVVIHEYGHGLIYSADSLSFGEERRTMDEANCDYFAASYSRLYDYWQDSWVFNWDGHNEFWNGRVVTSNAYYPTDYVSGSGIYINAPIWSSAMMRIERNIGRDETHDVLLSALYNFSSNITMPQAAELVLDQDSILYNEKNYGVICHTFLDKGLVNSCKVNRPPGMVGISTLNPELIQVNNSLNFAQGLGNISIQSGDEFHLQVYGLGGELISDLKSNNNVLELKYSDFKSGIYILKIFTKSQTKTVRIMRF